MALSFGKVRKQKVYYVGASTCVNPSLFELKTNDVQTTRLKGIRDLWFRMQWGFDTQDFFDALQDEILKLFHRYTMRSYISGSLKRILKSTMEHFRSSGAGVLRGKKRLEHWDALGPVLDQDKHFKDLKIVKQYLFRSYIREPIAVNIPEKQQKFLEGYAKELGVSLDMKVVTIHAREQAFHQGEEMQDTQSKRASILGHKTDLVRNAEISSYEKSVDYLIGQGYTIVRLGDPAMQPYRRDGVIDLATLELGKPLQKSLLEVYFLLRSKFLLCGESGPYSVSYLTNTPTVLVNATDPVSGFPVRRNRLYILKRVHERQTGHPLSLNDLLTYKYLSTMREFVFYHYIDNTQEEILEAVKEMLITLQEGCEETPNQKAYHKMLRELAMELNKPDKAGGLGYVRKWGCHNQFLGDGRIGASYVDQHFQAPVN